MTPAQRNALGINDGPAGPLTIAVQVTRGVSVGTDTATLTVANTAPAASLPPSSLPFGPTLYTIGSSSLVR